MDPKPLENVRSRARHTWVPYRTVLARTHTHTQIVTSDARDTLANSCHIHTAYAGCWCSETISTLRRSRLCTELAVSSKRTTRFAFGCRSSFGMW